MSDSFIYVQVEGNDGSITLLKMEAGKDDARRFQNKIDAHRKKMQRHGRCKCRKDEKHLCDGVCTGCRFQADGDLMSLDVPVDGGDGEATRKDFVRDRAPSPEEIYSSGERLRILSEKLAELNPDGERIIDFFREGVSVSEMARRLGRNRRTFAHKLDQQISSIKKFMDR